VPKPHDTRSLVQQIVAEQKQQRTELKAAMHARKRRPIAPILAGLLIVVNAAVWMVFPPRTDTSGDNRTPGEVERDVRLMVASAASEVDLWRLNHGNVLPMSLADAGIRADSGVTYAVVDSLTFEVKGTGPRGVSVTYRSNTAITDFIDAGLGKR
jgi:hypothetical protein